MIRNDSNRGGSASNDGPHQADVALLAQLDATLEDAGIYVATEIDGDRLILSGEVDTAESRQAALDVAAAIAAPRRLRVEDALDVLDFSPDDAFAPGDADPDSGGAEFEYADPDANPAARSDPAFELDPDFTDSIGTTDSQEAAAEAIPYFPPTDPVVRPTTDHEQLAVVGGFAATSMDDLAGAAGFDNLPDDQIAQDVRRELLEDALTTDLVVQVAAINGIVLLRGEVPTLEDAENAEAVASRVGGVKEVREELRIASLSRPD